MNIDKEKIIAEAKSLFNKKTIILIITVIAITVVATYIFLPTKETIKQEIVVQRDDAAIAILTAEYEKKLKDQRSLIDKLTGQNKPSKPPSGTIGKPTKPPIEEDILPPIGGTPLPGEDTTNTQPTVKDEPKKAYAYDIPFFIKVDRNEISISTQNPYLYALGENYQKQYIYSRDNEDFEIAITKTKSINTLDGIILTFDNRFFTFDGVYIGAGSRFPKQWYLSLDAEFTFVQRLKIIPKITSTPFIGIDARFRLFK